MPQVRPPLDTFAHEPDALAVANSAVVEPVAGELEAVVAELEQQIPLQGARGFVGDPTPTKVGMDREPAEVRDPVDLASLVDPITPARSPSTITIRRPNLCGSASDR